MKSVGVSSIAWALTLSISLAQVTIPHSYTVDPARSRIEVAVSRGGLLKVLGHDHVIMAKSFSGQIRFDPGSIVDSSVQLNIDARSLVVLDDPNLSEKDSKQIQDTMEGAKILDTQDFPQITFHSTGVSRTTSAPEGLTLQGRLLLHGVEKEIVFPVQVHPEADLLHVTGIVVIAQTDFGIKPIKAAAGGIRVKDQVRVMFEIFARKAD
jgi:polyisoprenoid-binding protein YceI